MHACAKCGNQAEDGRGWVIEGNSFRLCDGCNPQLCKLIKDWVALGLLAIPAAEFLK